MLSPGTLSPHRGTWRRTPRSLVSQLLGHFKAFGIAFVTSPFVSCLEEPESISAATPDNPKQHILLVFLDKAPWNRAGAEQALRTHLPSEQTGNRPHPRPPRTDSASGLMCRDWLPPEWLHPGLDSSPRPPLRGRRARVWTAAPLLQPPATPPSSLSFPYGCMSSPNLRSSPLDSSWTPSSVQQHPSLQARVTGGRRGTAHPGRQPHLSLRECSRASSLRFCRSHSRRALSCSSRCRLRRSCSLSFSFTLACFPSGKQDVSYQET